MQNTNQLLHLGTLGSSIVFPQFHRRIILDYLRLYPCFVPPQAWSSRSKRATCGG
jgi:hypothetical protein